MQQKQAIAATVTGNDQHVGFRAMVMKQAIAYNLAGIARNDANDIVHFTLQGDADRIGEAGSGVPILGVNFGSLGFLTLWPDSEDQPTVSTLNAYDGFVASNMAIVPNVNGSIDAYSDGLTQLILDISGYFAP